MMMAETNPIVGNVVTAVIVTVILGVGGWVLGVFEKGSDAATKEVIRAVLVEEMKTDAGITYAARISEIDGSIISMETRVGILQTDLDALEENVFDLASE
jgi:hypothetical protein